MNFRFYNKIKLTGLIQLIHQLLPTFRPAKYFFNYLLIDLCKN